MILWAMLAAVALAKEGSQEWKNPDCIDRDCEVRAVRLSVTSNVSQTSASNSMVAEVEATEARFLAKYAFVQYVRGCQYKRDAQGGFQYGTRESLGRRATFLHENWEIDSQDEDPVYWSSQRAGYDSIRGFMIPRNADYLTSNPASGEPSAPWVGKVSNLRAHSLFVSDAPSASMVMLDGSVVTTSLEFMLCLYQIEELPLLVMSPKMILPRPLVCLNWDSNYQRLGATFERASEIDIFCRPSM